MKLIKGATTEKLLGLNWILTTENCFTIENIIKKVPWHAHRRSKIVIKHRACNNKRNLLLNNNWIWEKRERKTFPISRFFWVWTKGRKQTNKTFKICLDFSKNIENILKLEILNFVFILRLLILPPIECQRISLLYMKEVSCPICNETFSQDGHYDAALLKLHLI